MRIFSPILKNPINEMWDTARKDEKFREHLAMLEKTTDPSWRFPGLFASRADKAFIGTVYYGYELGKLMAIHEARSAKGEVK